jgi:S-adenosylmethionine-dependent methyltransferase
VAVERLLPRGSRRRAALAAVKQRAVGPRPWEPPAHVTANFRPLTDDVLAAVREALEANYFDNPDAGFYHDPVDVYLATAEGAADMADHLTVRLDQTRHLRVPWLDELRPLKGARVLEIGCGTGASAVAFAEQGAVVTAIDVDAGSLRVAEVRARAMHVALSLEELSATDVAERFGAGDFDVVLFFASLEHMTLDERVRSLQAAWGLLRSRDLLVVVEAPNRLWWYDSHTAMAPFFHWLPDDLAVRYAPRTPRQLFRRFDPGPDAFERLARWGRGVSYHDFEVALDIPAERLPVAGYQEEFRRRVVRERLRVGNDARYEAFLRRVAPHVSPAFLLSHLDLALQKP